MDISEHISAEMIEIKSGYHTKDEVIDEIADMVIQKIGTGKHSKHEVARRLREREELGTTGFGNHIAIPHCALHDIDEFILGFILYPDGAEFDSMDEKPVKFVAFIIAPEKKRNQHIRYLSEVSGVLRQPEALDAMFEQLNSVSVREKFLKFAAPVGKDKKLKEEYSMLRIFCQNEQKFYEIMKILSAVKERDISVLDASDAKDFIDERAFFGKLWNEKKTKFHKIIFAVVPTELANDMIRKINNLIGELKNRRGVMVIMQKIDYISGYLND